MKRISVSIYVALACACTALAGIYGTSPVANTVWTAGRMYSVTWTDDKTQPKLDKLGPLSIELYSGTDSLMATLGQDIDPESKSLSAWISPAFDHDGSDYYIAFKCDNPPVTVFSASFTIVGTSDVIPIGHERTNSTAPTGTSKEAAEDYITGADLKTSSRSTLSTLTVSSRTTTSSTHSFTTTPSLSLGTAQPSTTLPLVNPDDTASHPTKISAAGSFAQQIDFERLKFRIVFIFWPALIGITMAL